MKKIIILFIIVLLCAPNLTYAWSEHGLMTAQVIDSLAWLKTYNGISITPYTYQKFDKSVYNKNFVIKYLEGNVGDTTDALTILSLYSDEPDWAMDTELNLSPLQILTGNSQGYRHQRYVAFGGLLRAGVGHKRVQHFYNLSRLAFKNNDPYWGFRFLARSMHYLQDLTQPQHTLPAPTRIILREIIDINSFTIMCVNHHVTLEDFYQATHIKNNDEDYIRTLREARPVRLNNPYKTAIRVSIRSRKYVNTLWQDMENLFGSELSAKKQFSISLESLLLLLNNPEKKVFVEKLDKTILNSLTMFSSYSKGLLELAKRDFKF